MRVVFKDNDITDSITGINLSIWFAGCPHKCLKCHNKELWDKNSLPNIDYETVMKNIVDIIKGSPIEKGVSILGGEPLSSYNINDCKRLIIGIRKHFPNIKIYLWTGYLYEELKSIKEFKDILKNIDYLIDGPFDYTKYKPNLLLKGSTNQRVFKIEKFLFWKRIKIIDV